MIAAIARLLEGLRHVAVGAASPVPAAASLLARELSDGSLTVSILGSERHNPFTDGGRELFDCAAQGRLDAFFLSGAQIDATGAVNLLGLGRPQALSSAAFWAISAPPTSPPWSRTSSSAAPITAPSTLVEKVDFVTAPGREGRRLVTDRCVFIVRERQLRLDSRHPAKRSRAFARPPASASRPARRRHHRGPDAAMLTLLQGPSPGRCTRSTRPSRRLARRPAPLSGQAPCSRSVPADRRLSSFSHRARACRASAIGRVEHQGRDPRVGRDGAARRRIAERLRRILEPSPEQPADPLGDADRRPCRRSGGARAAGARRRAGRRPRASPCCRHGPP
jgi:glutaconate CoA-transferase, subunit B